MRHALELRPEFEQLREKVQSLPPSGDGLRLAPLMDIFVLKAKPDDAINRIDNLEKSAHKMDDLERFVRRIENLE